MSAEYRVVRVNTRDHRTPDQALEDMATIIRHSGYWTQNDEPPRIPVGTQLVAMGSYGGRGYYLIGVASGGWDRLDAEDAPFRFRMRVAWADVIYDVPGDPEEIGALISRFNPHSWSRCTQDEYRQVVDRVLAGRELAGPGLG